MDGFLFLDKAKFHTSFAGDVCNQLAGFMQASQVPFGLEGAGGKVSDPAWQTRPSCYLLTINDKMIPPRVQKLMADRAKSQVTEVAASHAVYVSQPKAVARIIEKAAQALSAK
ncbi:alpha/beta hydrolase [Mesorhizobium sp. M0322]